MPNMSRLSQISNHLPSSLGGYTSGSIDQQFSPFFNYVDEFDRHFSRHHRFLNCFIPRFDLEEDERNYYLIGDIPGAGVEDVEVEARDRNTIVVKGRTDRVVWDKGDGQGEEVRVEPRDGERIRRGSVGAGGEGRQMEVGLGRDVESIKPAGGNTAMVEKGQETFPPPPVSPITQGHSHHQRRQSVVPDREEGREGVNRPGERRVLVNERLVGEYHRTFSFPMEILEEDIRAFMENGVLNLVVPKRERGVEKKGRRVEVRRGRYQHDGEVEVGRHGERRDDDRRDGERREGERREGERREGERREGERRDSA